jgi:DNA mismatch repair protein MutS2
MRRRAWTRVTLAPNYQLRLGVPGASAGIQTGGAAGAERQHYCCRARERLGSQQVDIARFLDRLHNELAQLEEERKAAREQQYALNQERAKAGARGRCGDAQPHARA